MTERRFLYYAFGGGLGHVMRTVSLARQLAKSGGQHVVVSNSPFVSATRKLSATESIIKLVTVDSNLGSSDCFKRISEIHDALRPDMFIVDTFPRGLGGELLPILENNAGLRRVLVSRRLPPRYVVDYRLVEFVEQHYDLVIAPGEVYGVQQGAFSLVSERPEYVQVAPFLIRDAEELPSRRSAARQLRADPDLPLVLVVGSGNEAESRQAESDFALLCSRVHDLQAAIQLRLAIPVETGSTANDCLAADSDWVVEEVPLMNVLPAVDLVIGSAGYNLYWETQSLQIPSLLFARRRKYDQQDQRPGVYRRAISLDHLLEKICSTQIRCPAPPDYTNGAAESAHIITERYSSNIWLAP